MAVIHATEYDAAERQFAKAVGELESADQLLALLDERHPAYTEQPAAVVTRMRAWVLLALSRAAELPAAALPFVLEELETPHDPYLVAVAAICLRHYAFPHPSFADALCQALLFAKARDYPVDLEIYGGVGGGSSPLREVDGTLAWLKSAAPPDSCCPALPAFVSGHSRWNYLARRKAAHLEQVMLEDQFGRKQKYGARFHGHPTIVVFFYSRCENPLKCTLTVWKLGHVQQLLAERGLADSIHTAAITYDPAYDTPDKLLTYGRNRNLRMDERNVLLRAPEGFEELQRHFALGGSFFESLVSRHKIEVFVLDKRGRTAASFERKRWREEDVVEEAAALLAGTGSGKMARFGSWVGLLAPLVPKCPICWAAYMSSFGVTGFVAQPSASALRALTAFFLLLHLAVMAWRLRATSWHWSYALSLGGVLAIALNWLWSPPATLTYLGAAAMLMAAVLSVSKTDPSTKGSISDEAVSGPIQKNPVRSINSHGDLSL